ncbi:unnamed protein product [Rodentolepis nana]|uniref:RIIa domain-containing protein n=1 Tax=Rodentolepis nana TaxID=102285 RepID=A0A0R3TGD1_RODNA|nr:unnamed protein product [Rodentolepis nana]
MEDELYVQELDDYVKRHNIHKILRESIVNLCLYRPENPIHFLHEYFEALDVSSSNSHKPTSSSTSKPTVTPPVKEFSNANNSYPSPSAGSEPSSMNPDNIPLDESSTSTQRRHSGEQWSSNQNGLSDGDDTSEARFHSSPILRASSSSCSAGSFNATRRVRRGAVSGEVYTEEDAASYVKKVILSFRMIYFK